MYYRIFPITDVARDQGLSPESNLHFHAYLYITILFKPMNILTSVFNVIFAYWLGVFCAYKKRLKLPLEYERA